MREIEIGVQMYLRAVPRFSKPEIMGNIGRSHLTFSTYSSFLTGFRPEKSYFLINDEKRKGGRRLFTIVHSIWPGLINICLNRDD
jgi:hypothetical protein